MVVHRRGVGHARGGLPRRCLRLEPARGRAGSGPDLVALRHPRRGADLRRAQPARTCRPPPGPAGRARRSASSCASRPASGHCARWQWAGFWSLAAPTRRTDLRGAPRTRPSCGRRPEPGPPVARQARRVSSASISATEPAGSVTGICTARTTAVGVEQQRLPLVALLAGRAEHRQPERRGQPQVLVGEQRERYADVVAEGAQLVGPLAADPHDVRAGGDEPVVRGGVRRDLERAAARAGDVAPAGRVGAGAADLGGRVGAGEAEDHPPPPCPPYVVSSAVAPGQHRRRDATARRGRAPAPTRPRTRRRWRSACRRRGGAGRRTPAARPAPAAAPRHGRSAGSRGGAAASSRPDAPARRARRGRPSFSVSVRRLTPSADWSPSKRVTPAGDLAQHEHGPPVADHPEGLRDAAVGVGQVLASHGPILSAPATRCPVIPLDISWSS